MLAVRNRKNQPFTFNLKDGKTIYLGPRETASVAPELLSDELRSASEKGLVEISTPVTESAVSPAPDAVSEESAEGDGTSSKRRK